MPGLKIETYQQQISKRALISWKKLKRKSHLGGRRLEKRKRKLDTRRDDVKTKRNLRRQFWGVLRVGAKPSWNGNLSIRRTTVLNKKDIKVCVYFHRPVYFCLSKPVDLFSHSVSPLSATTTKKKNNNKKQRPPHQKKTKNKNKNRRCFICSSLFPTVKLQWGLRWKLKASCYTHRPVRTVEVQMSM